MKLAAVLIVVVSLPGPLLQAQDATTPVQGVPGQTMVVMPFENLSPTPGLEWLGESFPETFHQQLNSPVLYVSSREERLRACDRQGIPASLHPSRATLYRLAEQMDVDYAVLGSYRYDGAALSVSAQLLDMRAQKLLPELTETAPLANLGILQAALAWDMLHQIRPSYSVTKEKYVAGIAAIRLDALENYVQGILVNSADERVQHLREAVRLNPNYAEAWLELGEAYYSQHNYEAAIDALSQLQPSRSPQANSEQSNLSQSSPPSISASISASGAVACEASFYLGLAAYALGDFAKSASAFEFVAARLPLAEVYNNVGVVAAHRGQKKAAEYFEHAIQNDPSNPDYHFNLGITLVQSGNRAGAIREMRSALEHRPNDAEAKTVLDSITPPAGSIPMSNTTGKVSLERINRHYEADAFRQMTIQMSGWAEQRFPRSDAQSHGRYHVELGKELMAHGFTAEAESEFEHAAAVDPSSTAPLTALAEDYDAKGDAVKARAQAEASLRLHESADAYLFLAQLDLRESKIESATQNINRALQLEPGNRSGQDLKRNLAAKLAEKAQPLSQP